MKVLGIDFDNTIIKYDELFHRIAFEKGLIPQDLPIQKDLVRNYLRDKGAEDKWTLIQGEVYGERIKEAVPFSGMKEILRTLKKNKISIKVISHKTKKPYLGPKRDLHKAAMDWLKANKVIGDQDFSLKEEEVFFEITKESKIDRIIKTGCTDYLDDLPEILEMIPNGINKILFSPTAEKNRNKDWTIIKSWKELPSALS